MWFGILAAIVLAAASSTAAEVWRVSTFAGYGQPGSRDGVREQARFASPAAVAADADGNIYVVEMISHVVRKISPEGAVITLAGKARVMGTADGPGPDARFFQPDGVAVDAAGNVFVADNNYTIRKISSTGIVSTVAGLAGQFGTANGTGPAARFLQPAGMAFAPNGNLVVADAGGNSIRIITPAGLVENWPMVFTQLPTVLNFPFGVAVDATGNLFVADAANAIVRKVTPGGQITNYGGFNRPVGVALDNAGNVLVSDIMDHVIRKLSPLGVVTVTAGAVAQRGSVDGAASTARFSDPGALCFDDSGNLFVADTSNKTIRKITPNGTVTTFAGQALPARGTDGPAGLASFEEPAAVAVDAAGNVFVVDAMDCTIRKITPSGVVSTIAGAVGQFGSADGPGSTARFAGPRGIAVDHLGNIYVADTINHTIRKIDPANTVTTLAGTAGLSGSTDGTGAAARFGETLGLTVDAAGNVYVADHGTNRVRKISPSGVVSTPPGVAASGIANGVAIDADGNFYVTDSGDHVIRKTTPSGVVTVFAGTPGAQGQADGVGVAARFSYLEGLAISETGVLYVSDSGNNTLRQITPAGEVTTIAGTPTIFANDDADGVGADAAFNLPAGLALSANGTLYIADMRNRRIRQAQVARPVPTVPGTGTLLNLSSRAYVGTGGDILIGGLAIQEGRAAIVIRAIGPGLLPFHVTNFLATPKLTAYAGQTVIAENIRWETSPDAAIMPSRFQQVSAFPLSAGSADSALLLTLDPGSYTLQVAGADGGTGVALLEVYLDTASGLPGRSVNLSSRARVGTGSDVLIAGFAVQGNAQVMLRGVGPKLSAFQVHNVLCLPQLDLFQGVTQQDSVGAWSANYEAAAIEPLFAATGAFALDARSTDSCHVINVNSGSRTVHLRGSENTTGVGLAEIYLVQP